MGLTTLQKQLIALLKHYITEERNITPIMLMLKDEKQQWEMVDYIAQNKETATNDSVMKKAIEIAEQAN